MLHLRWVELTSTLPHEQYYHQSLYKACFAHRRSDFILLRIEMLSFLAGGAASVLRGRGHKSKDFSLRYGLFLSSSAFDRQFVPTAYFLQGNLLPSSSPQYQSVFSTPQPSCSCLSSSSPPLPLSPPPLRF